MNFVGFYSPNPTTSPWNFLIKTKRFLVFTIFCRYEYNSTVWTITVSLGILFKLSFFIFFLLNKLSCLDELIIGSCWMVQKRSVLFLIWGDDLSPSMSLVFNLLCCLSFSLYEKKYFIVTKQQSILFFVFSSSTNVPI